uniref:WD repeat-containing and planar cell polarity effector protein fritz homolog isoform X1 n=1 Tax=Myxine glutinosa TaxID=7769 RepID=UPI00358E0B58
MAFFQTELHLWTMKRPRKMKGTDISYFQYHDKGETVPPCLDALYLEDKRIYAENRGYTWVPTNSRPEKLRETLKELEEVLQKKRCLCLHWIRPHCCQLLFDCGLLVTLGLAGLDLEYIEFDRALTSRLSPNVSICDGLLTDNFVIFAFADEPQLTCVMLGHKHFSQGATLRLEKLSSSDMKTCTVDLPGPRSGQVNRHLAMNPEQNLVVCWWVLNEVKDPSTAMSWAPVPMEQDRATLALVSCGKASMELLAWLHTDGDLVCATFCPEQLHHVRLVEWNERSATATSSLYECFVHEGHVPGNVKGNPGWSSHLRRVGATTVPLSSRPVCAAWSRDGREARLALGCAGGQLVVLEEGGHHCLQLSAAEELSVLSWHPNGLVLAAVAKGPEAQLQFLDAGLSVLHIQPVAEEPSPLPALELGQWGSSLGGLLLLEWVNPWTVAPGINSDTLMLLFEGGPLGILHCSLGGCHLGLSELVAEHLQHERIDEALKLVSALGWDSRAHEAYAGIVTIAEHLLRQHLTPETEAQLEAALGIFYTSNRPLPEESILKYRDMLGHYARRFFHILLRFQQFEKAFLLAIDIGARDLFMDLHYAAAARQEWILSMESLKKAEEIETISVTTGIDMLNLLECQDDRLRATCSPQGLQQSRSRGEPSRVESLEEPNVEMLEAALQGDSASWPDDSDNTSEEHDTISKIANAIGLEVVHLGLV